MVVVRFFGPIVGSTNGEKKTEVSASTVAEAIQQLCTRYGVGFADRILNSDGSLRTSLLVLVNGRDVRFMKQLMTEMGQNDELSLLPVVGGG